MNRNALRALAADAFHQVVDNWVFRILAVLALLPILFTFLVGMRADGVELLFGLKSWSYEELFAAFKVGALPPDPQGTVIGVVLALCFEFLAGDVGMLLALAATAFFVPRMLEKGTAELYFHKPVSRAWLLLSRYFAGLVFIALVGGVLVLGMYLGLLLVSRHHDPGVLVAALHLVYVFALIHSFSILCGVVTRSTVAAILLSSFFFFSNGCIHQGWIAWERADNGPRLELERDEPTAQADSGVAADEDRPAREASAQPSRALRVLRTTLDTLHFVLPKTTDAAFLARKLRTALERPEFRDEDALVTVFRLAPELERLDGDELSRLDPGAALRSALGEPRFAARSPALTFSLWRRPAQKSESRIGERVRVREESSTQAAQELQDVLEQAGATSLSRESARFGSDAGGRELSGSALRWQAASGAARAARVFRGSGGEWIYTLWIEAPGPLAPEDLEQGTGVLLGQLGLDLASVEEWYPGQLGFTAPLRFNILFSLGSSLAFAALMLFVATWKLRRIAF